jgi:hypothetical protein
MIEETRKTREAESLVWTNLNILLFDCGKWLNLLVENVPGCSDDVKKLVVMNRQGLRKKVNTLKESFKSLDQTQNERWENFARSLLQHFRDEVTSRQIVVY